MVITFGLFPRRLRCIQPKFPGPSTVESGLWVAVGARLWGRALKLRKPNYSVSQSIISKPSPGSSWWFPATLEYLSLDHDAEARRFRAELQISSEHCPMGGQSDGT
jgi:hypothetical protein